MAHEKDKTAAGLDVEALRQELREAMEELRGCYFAVDLLGQLLSGESEAPVPAQSQKGLAFLLWSIKEHMEAAIHGFVATGRGLGMGLDEVMELTV